MEKMISNLSASCHHAVLYVNSAEMEGKQS